MLDIVFDEPVDGAAPYKAVVESERWTERGYELGATKVVNREGMREYDGFSMEAPDVGVDHRYAYFGKKRHVDGVGIKVPDGETGRMQYNPFGDEVAVQDDVAEVVRDALGAITV